MKVIRVFSSTFSNINTKSHENSFRGFKYIFAPLFAGAFFYYHKKEENHINELKRTLESMFSKGGSAKGSIEGGAIAKTNQSSNSISENQLNGEKEKMNRIQRIKISLDEDPRVPISLRVFGGYSSSMSLINAYKKVFFAVKDVIFP